MKASGNTILITGGTSGIGRGLAERFHTAGNQVVVAGRRTDLLEEVATANPGMATVELDVADPDSIAAAFAEVTRRYPELNVLINNAGIMLPEKVLDPAHLAVAEDHVTVNLLGPIRLLTRFAPFLAGRSGATVVNVTSGLAYVPLAATPTYCATKAGLHMYSEALRFQLADSGIQVIELAPPATRTTLMGQENAPHAMPLHEFLDESMHILATEPDADHVYVERVRKQRYAELNGEYDQLATMLAGRF